MPFTTRTEAALLNWVNTFPLEARVKALTELSDGLVLAEMLKDIDPQYAVENLEKHQSPSLWLRKKQSLEAVYKSLLRYIRDCCEETDSVTFERAIDFNAIAEGEDTQQMIKLLTILLIAAMKGTTGPKYYEKLMTLDQADQLEIAEVIQQMESPGDDAAEPLSPRRAIDTYEQDRDLALEEQHASLRKAYEDLKKRHADYITRFERLEQSHYDLQEHSKEADRELESLRLDSTSDRSRYTESLQEKLREANDLIASQERQLEVDREFKDRQTREIAAFKNSNRSVTELQDELAVLRNENEGLLKKANALDNYQKKLDRMSRIEGENETLRRRLDVLQENQTDYDKVFQENATLQRTTDEYRVRFQTYEEDLLNLNREKKHVESELYSCRSRVQILEEKTQHDERFIEDLQDQLKGGAPRPISPTSPQDAQARMNLEDELENIGSEDQALQISRLKAENQLLKSKGAANGLSSLRASLEELERKYKRLQQNHQDLTERHSTLSFQLTSLTTASMSEKDEAVVRSRNLYLAANEEVQTLRKQLTDAASELSSRERHLTSARADLAALRDEDRDTLASLKDAHELVTTSLEMDIRLLRDRCDGLSDDAEQANKHLLEALLAKNQLDSELKSARIDSNEHSAKQIQKQAEEINELQMRLKEHESGDAADAQKSKDPTLLSLQRENALMTTAWYDLTSRLQSNHVILQRRQDAPRSWLGRQRGIVVGGSGGAGSLKR